MADIATEAPSRLKWQEARIEALEMLTPRIRRVVMRPKHWYRPLAGQHVDVRLTAEDGYQAQRSYSLLSPPWREDVYELAIERMPDGEVSPWFHDAALAGDTIEILGPVGGHFVWHAADAAPTLLVGGGSGIVPLLAMAAHHTHSAVAAPMALVVGARTLADVVLWPELQRWEAMERGFESRLALSRESAVTRPQDHTGRIRESDLASALQRLRGPAPQPVQAFVCGNNGFVETIVDMLRALSVSDNAVRTERFGG